MKKPLIPTLALVLALTISACASFTPVEEPMVVVEPAVESASPPPPGDEPPPLSEANRAGAYAGYLTGLMEEKAGRSPEAVAAYRQAIALDPYGVAPVERAASLLLRMGDLPNAMALAETGLENHPDSIPLLGLMGGISSSLRRHEEAGDYFGRIVKIDPTRADAWIFQAVSTFHAGDEEGALVILDAYRKRFPDDPRGAYYKGRVLGKLARYDEAEELFRDLIKTHPDHIRAYEALGLLYRAQGRLDDAVKVYKEFVKKYPDNEEMRARLAETYVMTESFGDAISEYEDLLKFEPDAVETRMKLALTYLRRAEMSGSEEEYHKALKELQLIRAKEPDSREAIFYIASIFERLRQHDEAIEIWGLMIADGDPANREVHLKIAELYERDGRTAKALEHTAQALEQTPDDPEISYFHALLLGKVGRFDEGVEALNHSIDIDPRSDKYYFHLGVLLEKQKKYDQCIEAMKQALALKPDHPDALNYLGYLYADRGINLDEAEKLLSRALELSPDNGYFIDSLAWVYYRKGEYDKALSSLTAAIRTIPPDPTVFEHLGDIYKALGRDIDAVAAYEKSLAAEPEDKSPVDRAGVRKKLEQLRRGQTAPRR